MFRPVWVPRFYTTDKQQSESSGNYNTYRIQQLEAQYFCLSYLVYSVAILWCHKPALEYLRLRLRSQSLLPEFQASPANLAQPLWKHNIGLAPLTEVPRDEK